VLKDDEIIKHKHAEWQVTVNSSAVSASFDPAVTNGPAIGRKCQSDCALPAIHREGDKGG